MQSFNKQFEEEEEKQIERRGYRGMSRKSVSCQVVSLNNQAPIIK